MTNCSTMSRTALNRHLERHNIRLVPHPTAREAVEATAPFLPGTPILAVSCLVSVLLPEAKGRRCDHCHRLALPDRPLKKCTGCASYWYCDTKCHTLQWTAHHKLICKAYNSFTTSHAYQALHPHEKMDSMLLSHLLAQLKLRDSNPELDPVSPVSLFLSLLPGPGGVDLPPTCGKFTSEGSAPALLSRFGNNNFTMHSHQQSYGHGIFPLASRVFNHSCYPNAAAKYVLSKSFEVTMEIVALREIKLGEEICIPYLDPALIQSRQRMLEYTYGIRCHCPSCQLFAGLPRVDHAPKADEERFALARVLREFANTTSIGDLELRCRLPSSIPAQLQPAFHEEFFTYLTERFSEASHEVNYQVALESGLSVLALYLLVYPPNYPQIGMHLLELAKTAWNDTILHPDSSKEQTEGEVRKILSLANQVLIIYGPEGDDDGPLKEVELMRGLLDSSGPVV